MRQFREPRLSIWQSAVDEVVAKKQIKDAAAPGPPAASAGPSVSIGPRPDLTHPAVQEAAAYCSAQSAAGPLVPVLAAGAPAGGGLLNTAAYCSETALKLAEATILCNEQDCQRYKDELGRFTDCDPLYIEAAAKYAEYFVAQCKKIPYRAYRNLSDFAIAIPAQARIAVLGDWGTGLEPALVVLAQIAARKPHAVIHLGDVYYSGTAFENQNYFYEPWARILDLAQTKIPTFSLSGNHDMYSGGAGYYGLLDQLGQPASYFCLRNANWQFLAMDTGLHDSNPASGGTAATYLEDTELVWQKDKIDSAGRRRTVLLSHHPLFTAYENIERRAVNLRLYSQVSTFFPKVDLWLWGHEHNFVVYGPYMGISKARCIGHGGFPMGVGEAPAQPQFSEVPVIKKDASGKQITLGSTAGIMNHGYAIIDLDGADARIQYFQASDPGTPLYDETIP